MRTTHAVLVLFLLSAGCGGQKHLIRGYGESVRGAAAAQAPGRTHPALAVRGLDPQEAAIISDAYRGRLAPPGAKVDEPDMILVGPQGDARGVQLAPSVPRE